MSTRRLLGVLLTAAVLPVAAACTASPDGGPPPPRPAPGMRLVAFDTCAQLTEELRKAAREAVGPYGFGFSGPEMIGGARTAFGMPGPMGVVDDSATGTAADAFSQTNNHERAADEPDIVKTDGRRIVTVDAKGVLRVVDAATRTQTGRLDLDIDGAARLLLADNTALVLAEAPYRVRGVPQPHRDGEAEPIEGARLITVDLSGAPRVVSTYQGDGGLIDARLTGGTARIVLRSHPRIAFPLLPHGAEQRRVAANQQVIDATPAEAWLPRYEITADGRTEKGQVGCERVSRPSAFSGAAMVTVLTFDLARPLLGDGDPVAVVADGDTVYATATSLYVANDQRWLTWRSGRAMPADRDRTEIYRFDTAGGRPAFAGGGTVPGQLINQYAMSEWDGHLRIATTVDRAIGADRTTDRTTGGDQARSESAVHVLRVSDLTEIGKAGGLGKGERIYSVRFLGDRGYVVTFRETDPLYSLDLRDPARPRVTGELKITGYSAHLQPAGEGSLIGIGQEATDKGRTTGTQVSLFDVRDPARPKVLARHHVPAGWSEAEHDPHALLYWAPTGLLVLPVAVDDFGQPSTSDERDAATPGALALRITDTDIAERASIRHQRPRGDAEAPSVRRSLVVGNTLWTLSDAGLQANDLGTLTRQAWIPAS